MNKDIKNKVIVITGGADDGIGFTIAEKYLEESAKIVIILDNDEANVNKAVKKLNHNHGADKAVFIKCDVTADLEDVFRIIIDTHKSVDVLVNSVGITDDTIPRRMMDVNATSVIEWTMKFYEHMNKEKGGSGGTVINISSIFGYRVIPLTPIYQAAKFAITGFSRSLGHEYNFKKSGVRVVALCPGFTETKATRPMKDEKRKQLLPEDLVTFCNSLPWQNTNAVGDAAVEVFKTAESGTVWLIEDGKPVVEIN